MNLGKTENGIVFLREISPDFRAIQGIRAFSSSLSLSLSLSVKNNFPAGGR